jgi:hypothetical protein
MPACFEWPVSLAALEDVHRSLSRDYRLARSRSTVDPFFSEAQIEYQLNPAASIAGRTAATLVKIGFGRLVSKSGIVLG